MGKDSGGADDSGMMMAMASVEAANKAYDLGMQQLDWTKEVWNKEQPLIEASEQAQLDYSKSLTKSLDQMQNETQQQYQLYTDVYQPLEEKFAGEAQNWDSPENMATARAKAMGSVASQGNAGINTAAETLRGYGVDPSSQKYASLYTSAQPMLAAAEASAGNTASENLHLQKMALEGNAINTGRGMINATGSLTQAGTGAGSAGAGAASGAGATAMNNLSTGSTAMTNPSQWFNAGTNAMNSYVGAVNGYNDSNAKFAEAAGSGMQGMGAIAGALMTKFLPVMAKGGAVGYADGGMVDDPNMTPQQGGGQSGIPSSPVPPGGTPGGGVPAYASPSMGAATDDVPAMLTANEFVIPKDVATWKGHEYFAKQIDQARRAQQQFSQRDDIGGEPTQAIPQSPTFVSRPQHMGATAGAIPGMPG